MAAVASRERLSPGAAPQVDTGKYVRYTPEQVEALERVYSECPKPSSLRRQQLIRDCPILSNIEPKQIKVWFQNRRSVISRSIYCSSYGHPVAILPAFTFCAERHNFVRFWCARFGFGVILVGFFACFMNGSWVSVDGLCLCKAWSLGLF
jgi:hypothetical protein